MTKQQLNKIENDINEVKRHQGWAWQLGFKISNDLISMKIQKGSLNIDTMKTNKENVWEFCGVSYSDKELQNLLKNNSYEIVKIKGSVVIMN